MIDNSLPLETALQCFQLVSNYMKSILTDDIDDNIKENEHTSTRNNTIIKAIETIDQGLICVAKESIFSKNEEVDDINTSSLKYIFLDYYKAKCYASLQCLDDRLSNILIAKDSYNSYIESCMKMKILGKDDLSFLDINNTSQTPEMKRLAKIEKFKRNRDAKNHIAALQKLLYTRKISDDDLNDQEENFRELYITQLQYYAREAIDEIDLIKQELIMLRFKEQHIDSSNTAIDRNTRMPVPNRDGPGISVTKTYKVGDQLLFSRETIKVFGSHIAAPTMTLEEFGDQEKLAAESRSSNNEDITTVQPQRRYNQLYEDGDEEDNELVDHATYKDREWDDWKDNNPKGWGNKMGKRF